MDANADSMSEKLKALTSVAPFKEVVGSRFRIHWGTGDSAELELVSAEGLKASSQRPGGREPFALIFRADSTRFYLPQAVYRLDHEKVGSLEIFLVPVGPDEKGMRFEAVFN